MDAPRCQTMATAARVLINGSLLAGSGRPRKHPARPAQLLLDSGVAAFTGAGTMSAPIRLMELRRARVVLMMRRRAVATTRAMAGQLNRRDMDTSERPSPPHSSRRATDGHNKYDNTPGGSTRIRGYQHAPKKRPARVANDDQPPVREYPGNANDKTILQLLPDTKLQPAAICNIFDYPRNIEDRYDLAEVIGTGSFGTVYRAYDLVTGEEYACKSIAKIPNGKRYSNPRHLLKARSEIDCMARLGSSLDAVFLVGQYEDDTHVHLVMELCEGGTLMEAMGNPNTTEDDVALVMRSVFRFLALCHSRDLVFRDVKPENFLFAVDETSNKRTLKATDFGLAIRIDDKGPMLTVPAGTPVYVAPEVFGRFYGKPCDVYSAGVMAFQLLTGRYPYWPDMDFNPLSISQLSRVVRDAEIDVDALSQEGISQPAIDLLRRCLAKDPGVRMTAEEALRHPWTTDGVDGDDEHQVPLHGTAVQRLQRFATHSHLKQRVLSMMFKGMLESDEQREELIHHHELGDLRLEPVRAIFEVMDKDRSGSVSIDSIVEELSNEGYSLTDAETQQLLRWIDADNDGRVSFEDFACSLLDWDQVERSGRWETLVTEAFDVLDENKDGSISLEEVQKYLTRLSSSCGMDHHHQSKQLLETPDAMVRDFDGNYDGEISFDEFLEGMSSGNTAEFLDCFDRRRRLNSFTSSSSMWECTASLNSASCCLDDEPTPFRSLNGNRAGDQGTAAV